MGVNVLTFGCRLNIHESEVIRRDAAGLGDATVVNTCAVTGEAVRQARQAIRKVRREQPQTRIIVTGCAAQADPQIFATMPEVDRVIGNEEKLVPQSWADDARVMVGDIMTATRIALPTVERIEGHTRAFVQVQNGCDHRCTFCIIPFGRGNSRSLSAASVVTQVRKLVANGYREVVLTGVDITSYQSDDAPKLGRLVKMILKAVPELERLRLSSIDSVEADLDLLDALAHEARLMPHLHLSLQAGDDLILKRMKRRHARADAIAFCNQVRRLRPDVVFGGDVIAGFPTETEVMFARSLDLVDDCGLTHLHVFPFSARPGTPAARMPQVPRDVIKQRAKRLRDKGEVALHRHLDSEIGMQRRVLTEAGDIGRTEQFTPVKLSAPVARGLMLDLTVAGHDGRQLIAA